MIVGPSRSGKTEWARSLGRHNYVSGMWDLRSIDCEADYIVLDDIDLDKVHNPKGWIGCQKSWIDTDKWVRKKPLSWGPKKCCIILCNQGKDWEYTQEWGREHQWYLSNIVIYRFGDGIKFY